MATYEQDLKADRQERSGLSEWNAWNWSIMVWPPVVFMLLAFNKEWIIVLLLVPIAVVGMARTVWIRSGPWPIVVFVALCAMAWWMD